MRCTGPSMATKREGVDALPFSVPRPRPWRAREMRSISTPLRLPRPLMGRGTGGGWGGLIAVVGISADGKKAPPPPSRSRGLCTGTANGDGGHPCKVYNSTYVLVCQGVSARRCGSPQGGPHIAGPQGGPLLTHKRRGARAASQGAACGRPPRAPRREERRRPTATSRAAR